MRKFLLTSVTIMILSIAGVPVIAAGPQHIMGEMAGEVTTDSVILQSRLTAYSTDSEGDVPGAPGVARFEIADNPDFRNSSFTEWISADPDYDFIIKKKITWLKPDTLHYYRLVYGEKTNNTVAGYIRRFKTLPPPGAEKPVSLAVVTGMNYGRFHYGEPLRPAYNGPDKNLGFPALETILQLEPDYFVATGDNVYYDQKPNATSTVHLRKKWHEQFVQPRFVSLFSRIPTYWLKDDHDHRYDDSDLTDRFGKKPYPSHLLGFWLFREQVPVTDPDNPLETTYRTHRMGKLLQVWMLEGRDYRSPNHMPDGPRKTMWGKEQRKWLTRTLMESDAIFKVIISPTPLVGPDSARKNDSHANTGGFMHEGKTFFKWLRGNGFLDKNLYLVCGDRHWQYHAVHPSGFEEFSSGALVDANSRLGVKPGTPDSTDPKGLIRHPYHQPEASGGFLLIDIQPGIGGSTHKAAFKFYDEKGKLYYKAIKEAKTD